MAIRVKSAADVVAKWVDVTPGRTAYYEKFAVPAGGDWEAGATAAAGTYKAGISVADIEGRYRGGVKRVGAEKYSRKVRDVGVARFGPGVTAARADYDKGVTPFLDEIAKLTLPPRAPRGDPRNLERVAVIAKALAAKRLAQRAAGV
jgi:hypothetical protein